jgi:hypothetical protein
MKIYNLQLKEWLHIEEGARDHKRWNHNNLFVTIRLNWCQPYNLLSLALHLA